MKPNIHNSWEEVLKNEFSSIYFQRLKLFLLFEKRKHIVYPAGNQIFSAFNLTPFDEVKVVIIGQDPYHGKGQANGLCFSVADGIRKPPSLKNIFKELNADVGVAIPESGNLEKWAKQGVLLINATLTVRASQAASHHKKGWEQFTDAVISKLSEQKKNLVFILWGAFAQDKAKLIDENSHHILKSPHPSPFSANRGFLGNKHFSQTNQFLKSVGQNPIDWTLE